MSKTKSSALPKKAVKPKAKRKGFDNDHDSFLRGVLGIMLFVRRKLEYILPNNIRPFCDLDSLKPAAETAVDGKLRYLASDCIYECALQQRELPEPYRSQTDFPNMRFCFLIESKSAPPAEPIDFQIEDYRKAIWSKDLKNNQFMGLVLPILIYNGKYAWNKQKVYDYFKKHLPPSLLAYIPNPLYLVLDLHAITDNEITSLVELGALRSVFLALKHGHDPDYFKKEIPNLFNFAIEDADLGNATPLTPKYLLQEFLKLLSSYVQRRAKLSEDEVIETILESKNAVMKTKVRTIFDVFQEKGMEEGLEKGLEKGIAIGEAKSEDRIKQAEAKVKETEAKAKETEAKAKETEAKAKETEAKAKETEAKAKETEAKLREIVKLLMITTAMTDEQLVKQFKLPVALVTQLRHEIANKP
ncbi:MAG: hypothetical protein RLZZ628_32 [Bacteroidota bacterium]|jgi:hypothetical protein